MAPGTPSGLPTHPLPTPTGDDYTGLTMLEVSDGELTDLAVASVTIDNVAPHVEVLTAARNPVLIDQTVSFEGSFTDPGWLGTHHIEWDFGDGETDLEDLGPAVSHVYANHAYVEPGAYLVELTVTE